MDANTKYGPKPFDGCYGLMMKSISFGEAVVLPVTIYVTDNIFMIPKKIKLQIAWKVVIKLNYIPFNKKNL